MCDRFEKLCEQENRAVSLCLESQEWEQRRSNNLEKHTNDNGGAGAKGFVGGIDRQQEVRVTRELTFTQADVREEDATKEAEMAQREHRAQVEELELNLTQKDNMLVQQRSELEVIEAKLKAATDMANRLEDEAADKDRALQSLTTKLGSVRSSLVSFCPLTFLCGYCIRSSVLF